MIYKPLSNLDILRKLPNCKFILYENMKYVKNIEELLPKTLILYQLSPECGHFCCIFENDEGINFFDPIGLYPDSELNYGGSAKNHDFTYLTRLLAQSDKPIIYNEHHLQKMNTNVCGHWCYMRLIFYLISCDDFFGCFKNIKDKDKMVYKLYNKF